MEKPKRVTFVVVFVSEERPRRRAKGKGKGGSEWEIGELPKHGPNGNGGAAGSAGTRLYPLGPSVRGPGNELCRR
jgi:hypothetical protein